MTQYIHGDPRQRKVQPFISPEAPPTPYERELLEILIEECAEVQQRATKMLRFGVNEVQPGQEHTNVVRMSHEIGDLCVMFDRLLEIGLVDENAVDAGRERKARQLAKYMQHEKD